MSAGAKTFREIAEHAADLPAWLAHQLGVRSWAGTPSGWTFARVLATLDHDELDQALSGWMLTESEPAEAVAVDGTTMRAATTTGQTDMPQTQVVAAMKSRGEILGQVTVQAGDKNTATRDLIMRLTGKAVEGTVITADAKHTSTASSPKSRRWGRSGCCL